MKNLIEFVKEALLTTKNRENLKKTSADASEYYDDPPMTKQQANRLMDRTPRMYWEAEHKMNDWHDGKRKENIKACKPEKLIMYWQICSDKGYRDQLDALEEEANRRGWTFTKLKEK